MNCKMACRPTLQVIFRLPNREAIKLSYGLFSALNELKTLHNRRHSHRWFKKTDLTTVFCNDSLCNTAAHYHRRNNPDYHILSSSLVPSLRLFAGDSKNIALQLNNSSECLLFDENGILIKKFILKDAKIYAQGKNSRLVYMNKNKDGLNCFRLQPLPVFTQPAPSGETRTGGNMETKEDVGKDINIDNILEAIRPASSDGDTKTPRIKNASKDKPKDYSIKTISNIKEHVPSYGNTKGNGSKKRDENIPKEFTIKSIIKEHDLLIKTAKIKALLTKGKPVKVIIQHAESEKDGGSSMIKKLLEELKTLGKLQTESSGKNVTRFTVTPAIQLTQSAS